MDDKKKFHVGTGLYVLAFILPIVGVIAGFVALTKSSVGPGLALWACAFWGTILSVVLLYG